MTTQASSCEKRSPNRRFFNAKYFRFRLKTGWPLLVVFVFIFMLSTVVTTVSFLSEEFRYADVSFDIKSIRYDTVDFLYIMGIINVVISMFCGLVGGMTTMRFTSNKVAVNFYHSLPMRREAIFTTSTLHSFTYYLTAFAGGLFLMFVIISVRLGAPGMYIRPLLLTLEYGVLFYFLLFAMTMFAASITGTGFMRFVGTAYVIFLPISIFALFILAISEAGIYNNIINTEYYLSADTLIALCSPFRLVNMVGSGSYMTGKGLEGFLGKDIVIVFVTALVFYGAAFLLYCLRHSESASHPVIWKPAGFVFKYATVFMGGTLFGFMFGGIFSDIGWMIFGIIIGSLSMFMLMNGILNKSARAIFKGVRGFGIYLAVMAVVTTVFYIDAFGMFSSVPNPSLVSKVELDIDGRLEAEYGGDFAQKVTKLIADAHDSDQNGDWYSYGNEKPMAEVYYDYSDFYYTETAKLEEEIVDIGVGHLYSGYSYDNIRIEAVIHTKFGIPFAVELYPNCEASRTLVEYVLATRDETEIELPGEIDGAYVHLGIWDGGGTRYFRTDITKDDTDGILPLIGMLSDPYGDKGESPVIGSINYSGYLDEGEYDLFYDSGYFYREYNITAADVEFLNQLMVTGEKFESEEDVLRYAAEVMGITDIYVVDNAGSEYVRISDEDRMIELLSCLVSFDGYYSYNTTVCNTDHGYNVFLFKGSEPTYSKMSFRKDAIPEWMTELFDGDGAEKLADYRIYE